MASITKKIKKGHTYYYAVECKRVDGEPRIVWQKYLGTLDAIVKRADDSKPPKPKHTVIFHAGGVAALLRITQRLEILDLINEVSPKREQGPTVGHYIVLAALNRALEPLSKLAIGNWYEQTVLRRLWGFDKSAFTSQRFWDHMDRLSEQDIERIQERLIPCIEKELALGNTKQGCNAPCMKDDSVFGFWGFGIVSAFDNGIESPQVLLPDDAWLPVDAFAFDSVIIGMTFFDLFGNGSHYSLLINFFK